MNAPVFILPTSGPATYRGKYPARVRSVSHSRQAGLHIELNDGTRLWTVRPDNMPTAAADCSEMLARAVPMTAEQYAELQRAAHIRREAAGLPGYDAAAEESRAILESIQPDKAETAKAALFAAYGTSRAELEAEAKAETAKPVRRDNVEYHAGKAAHAEGKAESDCPYMAGGDRAARWTLGFREAADAARHVVPLEMNWKAAAGIVRAALENGTGEGRRAARVELDRMAGLADERNAMAAALSALAIVANETAHCLGKPGTMARDEMDSALAAAFALLNAESGN